MSHAHGGPRHGSPHARFLLIGSTTTLALTLAMRWQFNLPLLLAYLAAVNVTTFGLYGYDKLVAGRGWTRVPEMVLHLFAFVGGTAAAWLAQKYLRHKTLKSSFQRGFRLLLAIQIVLVVWVVYALVSSILF